MSFSWAEPYPELHKMCILFDVQALQHPTKFSYSPLQPLVQNGPQCGLVALAMTAGRPTKQTVNALLEDARKSGFSYNGELFSVDDMCALAKSHLSHFDSAEIYTGRLDDVEIKEFLLNGGFMLVPYDTDKDNLPGLHRGHKAHWCIISGAADTARGFFVIARHGKAKNVAIWMLGQLADSNQQLFEFSPDRKLQDIEYKLPVGGISGPKGLNGRSVLIL